MLKNAAVVSLLMFAACGNSNGKYSQSSYSLTQYCENKDKTCICHIPPGNPENAHEICISDLALEAHWKHGKHGDYLGECNRCGNETCDSTENCEVCPEDCGQCPPPEPYCGNQSCDEGETCETCEVDCGQCPPVCGDEFCEERESCQSCETDCGECEPTFEPDLGITEPDSGNSNLVDAGLEVDAEPEVRCYEYYCEEVDAGNIVNLDSSNFQPDAGAQNNIDSGQRSRPPFAKPEENLNRAFAGGCMITNTNSSGSKAVSFIIIILTLLFIGFYRKKNIFYSVILIVLAVLLLANAAYAFPNTQNFRPNPGDSDFFTTPNSKLSLPNVSFFYQFEHRPVRLIGKPGDKTINSVVDNRHTLHLMYAHSFWNRVQFGLDLPVIVGQDSGNLSLLGLSKLDNGTGDLRLLTKIRLFNLGPVNFATNIDWALPTTSADLVGEKYGSVIPSLITSVSFGSVDLSTNVGFRLRADETFSLPGVQTQGAGQLFVASMAARWNFWNHREFSLSLVSDAQISTTLSTVTREEVPIEWLNGFQAKLTDNLGVQIGAGWGATSGVGNPIPRVFFGLSWNLSKKSVPCRYPKELIRWRTREKRTPIFVPIPVPIEVPTPVVITLPSVFFDTDKSDLRFEDKEKLIKAANLLKKYPQIKTVRIEGHTDYRASIKYNQALSERRVQSVIDFLKFQGVVTELQSQGFGELAPLDKTKTKEGMQKNRRVDLRVINIER